MTVIKVKTLIELQSVDNDKHVLYVLCVSFSCRNYAKKRVKINNIILKTIVKNCFEV